MKGMYLKINTDGAIETTHTEDPPTLAKLRGNWWWIY
jgi:hypothetical protein